MTIHTCDKCNKEIKHRPILISLDMYLNRTELCKTCAQPVIAFLKKEKLLKIEVAELA